MQIMNGETVFDEVIIYNCYSSHSGGAIAVGRGKLHLLNSVVRNNYGAAKGGGISGGYTDDGHPSLFNFTSSTFLDNIATIGSHFWQAAPGSTQNIFYNNNFTSTEGYTSSVTITSFAEGIWTCEPGKYMPRKVNALVDFVGCAYDCSAGYYGETADETHYTCSGVCHVGHYCPLASSSPIPCPEGTHLPAIGAVSELSCVSCAPGSYSDQAGLGNSSCAACAMGKYTEDLGSTACSQCPLGGYCPSSGGASARLVFQSCWAGTYAAARGRGREGTDSFSGTHPRTPPMLAATPPQV